MIVTVAVVALAVPATAAMAAPTRHTAPPAPELVQVGTYAYLTAPDYDALATLTLREPIGQALGWLA